MRFSRIESQSKIGVYEPLVKTVATHQNKQ